MWAPPIKSKEVCLEINRVCKQYFVRLKRFDKSQNKWHGRFTKQAKSCHLSFLLVHYIPLGMTQKWSNVLHFTHNDTSQVLMKATQVNVSQILFHLCYCCMDQISKKDANVGKRISMFEMNKANSIKTSSVIAFSKLIKHFVFPRENMMTVSTLSSNLLNTCVYSEVMFTVNDVATNDPKTSEVVGNISKHFLNRMVNFNDFQQPSLRGKQTVTSFTATLTIQM